MNVVIAIDSFKGSMTSMQAGLSAATGIKRVYKDAHITVRPLADGGEGTVDALVNGCDGRMTQVQVTGPSGHPVVCPYGIVDETHTAIIEMSGAAGITQVSGEEKNPLNTTTYGVGEVIKDAIQNGCRHFIVGIGGSATNDGGVGMLQALFLRFLHPALRREGMFCFLLNVIGRYFIYEAVDGQMAGLLCRSGQRTVSSCRCQISRCRCCWRYGVCFSYLLQCHTGIRY